MTRDFDIEVQRKLDSYKSCFRDMVLTMGREIENQKNEIKHLEEELQRREIRIANYANEVRDLNDKIVNLEDLYKQLTESENNIDPEEDLEIAEESVPF